MTYFLHTFSQARLSNVGNRRLNVITRMYEPYIPFWRRQLPYTILSASVVLFLILIALGSVVSVIVYRGTIRSAIRSFRKADAVASGESGLKSVGFLQKYSNIVVSSSAAGLNLIFILILNNLYSKIAAYLTELEMPRTQSEFDNSLTLKVCFPFFLLLWSSFTDHFLSDVPSSVCQLLLFHLLHCLLQGTFHRQSGRVQ